MSNELTVSHATQLIDIQERAFEFHNRRAKMLASSNLVPKNYRMFIEVKKGKETVWEENQAALANCIIAMEIAQRVGVSDLEVMQNLHIIEGRPSWSSQWLISAINTCGKYSTELDYEHENLGPLDASYCEITWPGGQKLITKKTVKINNGRCRAFATSAKTDKIVYGPWVTMEMAVSEGWYGKTGSKWQTMQEIMLEYRSASFFASTRCPEVKQGLRTKEEEEDIIDTVVNLEGTFEAAPQQENAVEKIKSRLKKPKGEVEKLAQESEIIVAPEDAKDIQEAVLGELVQEAQESGYYSMDDEIAGAIGAETVIQDSSEQQPEYSFE